MFEGNQLLRSAQEEITYDREMIEELARCAVDPIYFAEHYCFIVTIDAGKHLITMWEHQKRQLKACADTPDGKRHVIVLAPRQSAKTTTSAIYLLHRALFNKDKSIAILANKEKTALEIMSRVKMMFENLPLWMQPGIVDGGWNKSTIALGNGTRMFAASTSSSAIRGWTISDLYIDEFAFIPPRVAEEFMSSVYPTIASGTTSKVIVTSTPRGMNHFYQLWINAVRGRNNYFPVKIRWNEVPGRNEEWKRSMLKDIDPVKFAQEFLCKFIGSSSTLVDPDVLESMLPEDPVTLSWEGALRIFEVPKSDLKYVVGVDTSEGVGTDSSVVQVLCISDEFCIRQVAVFRDNRIDPTSFAMKVLAICRYYNEAPVLVETNGPGDVTARSLWYDHEYENMVNLAKTGVGFGIRATHKTKTEACTLLKQYIEHGWLKVYDQRTIFELSNFTEVAPGIFKADTKHGNTDDCVTSLYWALYYISTPLFDSRKSEKMREQASEHSLLPPDDATREKMAAAQNFVPMSGVSSSSFDEEDEGVIVARL